MFSTAHGPTGNVPGATTMALGEPVWLLPPPPVVGSVLLIAGRLPMPVWKAAHAPGAVVFTGVAVLWLYPQMSPLPLSLRETFAETAPFVDATMLFGTTSAYTCLVTFPALPITS